MSTLINSWASNHNKGAGPLWPLNAMTTRKHVTTHEDGSPIEPWQLRELASILENIAQRLELGELVHTRGSIGVCISREALNLYAAPEDMFKPGAMTYEFRADADFKER